MKKRPCSLRGVRVRVIPTIPALAHTHYAHAHTYTCKMRLLVQIEERRLNGGNLLLLYLWLSYFDPGWSLLKDCWGH